MAIESILQAIEAKEDREIDLFNVEFEKVLSSISLKVTVAVIEIDDPLDFDKEFETILNDSGYYDLIDKFVNESYDKSYEDILTIFAESGLSVAFSQEDITSINAIKQLDLDFFKDNGIAAGSQLKRDLFKYQLSNLDEETIIQNMRDSLAGTDMVRHSTTYATTAINNFNQEVIDLKSQDVTGEVYIYSGASPDKKIRGFCKCLMNQRKYYNKDDAQAIKKDPKRRYNCRHKILPVRKEWAEARAYESGRFTC